ncbi:MAG: hypothetical protein R3324_15800 [Halobacteriales archaeon]|nr:hypothetical protein [Halobacteriales archaeon]
MPSVAPREDLERAHEDLQSLEMKHPDAYADFAEFFADNRSLGYKNLCKLLMKEQTPRELKGVDEDDA